MYAWGGGFHGILGNGQESTVTTPTQILNSVKSIYSSHINGYAILKNGDLLGWGSNDSGQISSFSPDVNYNLPKKILGNIKRLDTGNWHNLALDESNNLWIWGKCIFSLVCDDKYSGTPRKLFAPTKIESGVVDFIAGNSFDLILTGDGKLWARGFTSDIMTPASGQDWTTKKKVMSGVIRIFPNRKMDSIGVLVERQDGSIWETSYLFMRGYSGAFGDKYYSVDFTERPDLRGKIGFSDGDSRDDPIVYEKSSMILDSGGDLYMFGDNSYGQLGNGTTLKSTSPIKVLDSVKLP